MTDPWIDSCRGSVPAWEVDHVGHFTVAYYHQRIEDAGFAALETLGLGPAYALRSRRGCLRTGCDVRYLHELRGGDTYHVRSGVLARSDRRVSGSLPCRSIRNDGARVPSLTRRPLKTCDSRRSSAHGTMHARGRRPTT